MMSAFGKLRRAFEHVETLVAEIEQHRATHPTSAYMYSNDGDANDPLLKLQWRVRIDKAYPASWPYIVGDVIQNCRSAMDHALCEVLRQEGMSAAETQAKHVQYPVADSDKKFRDATKSYKNELSEEVLEKLRSAQPYNISNPLNWVPIRILRDLSNFDKHRHISIISRLPVRFEVQSRPPLEVVKFKPGPLFIEDGSVLATIHYKRPTVCDDTDISGTSELTALEWIQATGMNDLLPLGRTLENIFAESLIRCRELLTNEMAADDQEVIDLFEDCRWRTKDTEAPIVPAAVGPAEIEVTYRAGGDAS